MAGLVELKTATIKKTSTNQNSPISSETRPENRLFSATLAHHSPPPAASSLRWWSSFRRVRCLDISDEQTRYLYGPPFGRLFAKLMHTRTHTHTDSPARFPPPVPCWFYRRPSSTVRAGGGPWEAFRRDVSRFRRGAPIFGGLFGIWRVGNSHLCTCCFVRLTFEKGFVIFPLRKLPLRLVIIGFRRLPDILRQFEIG